VVPRARDAAAAVMAPLPRSGLHAKQPTPAPRCHHPAQGFAWLCSRKLTRTPFFC
jgi:hypothetical protein